jgi:hypothetical protein
VPVNSSSSVIVRIEDGIAQNTAIVPDSIGLTELSSAVELLIADKGSAHITILPLSFESIVQGTWAATLTASLYMAGIFTNELSHASGDSITFKVHLSAGTYSIATLSATASNRGIMKIDIDAVNVAGFDLYSESAAYNVRSLQTAVVVSTSGMKTITLYTNTKNASSSGYYINFSALTLWRTA